jgi:hypothetical protein
VRTVRDDAGERYLLQKRSGDACLVRDPETGEERYVDADALTVEGRPPLVTAAEGVSESVRDSLPVAGERAVGLLADLAARGPLGVRRMLDDYELCESDLHGALAELRAAGLLAETRVAGERGYEVTDAARDALGR